MIVEAYDFRRPTTLAREHSRVLEAGFESFSRQWGTQLTAKVRAKSTVTPESVVMQSYDEYVSTLPATTSMVLCALDGMGAKMVLQFPTPSALGWVARMLGGHSDKAGLERKFTPLEYALVKSLVGDGLEVLSYSLGGLLPGTARVEAIQYNSQFAQAAATTDLMVVVAFTVRVGESASAATLAIPADALLPQLGAVNPMASSANAAELVRAQLARVPLDVAVRLEPAAVTPAQVLNLKVGDTIALPHPEHHPFHVAVGGKNLAQAMVVRKGSRVAARIVITEENHP
ncbi:flagellar motor switch protein FliM [Arthrobacter sp. YJM1]|nr:flagellar motor switch protein FliM [Arthrobacter sp. YJM1]MDP5226332.1 flagellar motor switch protein FliM [Arthrobacter sp. YJM1]